MIAVVLFILYLTVWLRLTVKRKPFEGYFSVFFVFGLAGLAYFTLIPLEMDLKGDDFYFATNWIKLGARERHLILLMSIISLFGFYYGLKMSRFRLFSLRNRYHYTNGRLNNRHFSLAVGILLSVIVFCISVLIIFYRGLFLGQYDYTTAYAITYTSPLYSFLKMHLLISLALMAGIVGQRKCGWSRKIICSTIVISIFSVGMLTADKNPLLIGLLTCGSLLNFWKISLKRFVTIAIVGSINVIILVQLFSLYRTRMPVEDLVNYFSLRSISFTYLDPAGPMISLANVLTDDSLQFKYGSTLINSLGVLIPRVIWPDRPLDLSEKFARENIAKWREGQGRGYSPLAEAFVNFNIPGAFILFFFYGIMLGWFLQFLKNVVFSKFECLLLPFIYIIVYYILILSFRSPFIGPIKMSLMFMMPYCVLFLMIRILARIARISIERVLCYQ